MEHGSPDSASRHVGDLGNIVSTDSTGTTRIVVDDVATENAISLQEDSISNILNRAIVIHENADNFTDASGYAGARIACGIIVQSTFNDLRKNVIHTHTHTRIKIY